jgi:hypothetical protein
VDRRSVTGIDVPLFGPWGRWFPYYGTGFGPSFGFVSFNPWGVYGATRWNWYSYGYYDPYNPYGAYYPYGSSRGYVSYGSSGRADRGRDDRTLGSIRLKANPKNALVYIDGALAGTVDDFDGLRDHLELEAGLHELELRADGYEPYTGELEVKAGKTLTERVSLKKVK